MIDIKKLDETVMQSKTVTHIIDILKNGNKGKGQKTFQANKDKLFEYHAKCEKRVKNRMGGRCKPSKGGHNDTK